MRADLCVAHGKQRPPEAAGKATRPIDRGSRQVVAAAEATDIGTVHQLEGAVSRFRDQGRDQFDRLVSQRAQRPLHPALR